MTQTFKVEIQIDSREPLKQGNLSEQIAAIEAWLGYKLGHVDVQFFPSTAKQWVIEMTIGPTPKDSELLLTTAYWHKIREKAAAFRRADNSQPLHADMATRAAKRRAAMTPPR